MIGDSPKELFAVAAGVVGGAFFGKVAFDQMFVEGMEDKARKDLIGFALGAGAVFGLAYLLGIDDKWVTGEAEVEALEKWAGK